MTRKLGSKPIYYYYSVFYDTLAAFVAMLDINFVSYAENSGKDFFFFLIFSFLSGGLLGDFSFIKAQIKRDRKQ
jgi:hypothetical protein